MVHLICTMPTKLFQRSGMLSINLHKLFSYKKLNETIMLMEGRHSIRHYLFVQPVLCGLTYNNNHWQ